MNKIWASLVTLILVLLFGGPITVRADCVPEDLTAVIAKLDAEFFDAYNRCDLEKFASFMDEKVEFYHDLGGVTWTRQEVVDAVKRNICGKVRREIVDGTLRVSPIKDFGAFEITDHRFCEIPSGKCVGMAQTAMLWRLKDGQWQVTRIFSYDHRAIEQPSTN